MHACLCAWMPLHLRGLHDMLAQGMLGTAFLPCCATAPDLAVMLLWAQLVMYGQPYSDSACTR